MPPERKSQPLPEHAALARAITDRLAERPGMTQVSVAERSGLSYELVNSYARGQGNPSYLNFMALARGLELTPKELMGRLEPPAEPGAGSTTEPAERGARAEPDTPGRPPQGGMPTQ
jgi:transcriptional regulator with XRE-family HTH domain